MAATSKGAQKGGPRRSKEGGADRYRVRRLDQMRALAHPLRLQLLEIFAAEECTTKQAALRLGERPTRLYHHVAALERAGLIRLQRTKPNRGTTEKYYRAVSPFFEVDPALATKKSERRKVATQGEAMARDVLHSALQDLRNLDWKGCSEEERPLLARVQMRISSRDAARVREGLIDWLREQQKKFSGSPDPDTPGSTLTLAFFPSVRRVEPKIDPTAKRGRK
jgi:DNA-binding transcriptional ArsR family regulator